MWRVEYTDEFRVWFDGLTDEDEVASIRAAVRALRDEGPTLPRPLADTLEGSAYPNMKELRPLGTSIRILFAFDPRRAAILLLGGDKARQWKQWYARNIPRADHLYAEHLRAVEEELAAQREAERARQGKQKRKKR